MNDNFPIAITNEADLDFYKTYLEQEFKETTPRTFLQKLNDYIEAPIKIECLLGNRIETKIGHLSEVGEDFILLKSLQNRQKLLLHLSTVKAVMPLKENHIRNNSTICKK